MQMKATKVHCVVGLKALLSVKSISLKVEEGHTPNNRYELSLCIKI